MIPELVTQRRSIRSFRESPVPIDDVRRLVEAACMAPAPHHSRPWRWVCVRSAAARRRLATDMGDAWRRDLERDDVDPATIDDAVAASHARIERSPAVLLGCLTDDGLDRYPDAPRRAAEHGMALLSLGAAVENLMLTASHLGYASCWVAAPIFCPEVARDSLDLPGDWLPQAMVLVGRPDESYAPPERPPIELDGLLALR